MSNLFTKFSGPSGEKQHNQLERQSQYDESENPFEQIDSQYAELDESENPFTQMSEANVQFDESENPFADSVAADIQLNDAENPFNSVGPGESPQAAKEASDVDWGSLSPEEFNKLASQKKALPPRDAWGVVSDLAKSYASGSNKLVSNLLWLGDAALPGEPFKGARETLDGYSDRWNNKLSDQSQQANQAIADAEGAMGTLEAIFDNPEAIPNFLAQSAPSMVPGALLGKLVPAYATAANIAANSLLEGSDSAASTEKEVYQFARQQGLDDKDSSDIARAAAGKAFGVSALMSAVASKITGAGKIEADLYAGRLGSEEADQGLKGFGKTIAKETAEEALQESGNTIGQNYGVGTVDRERGLLDGVPKSAVLGATLGLSQATGIQGLKMAGRAVSGQEPGLSDSDIDGAEGLDEQLDAMNNTQSAFDESDPGETGPMQGEAMGDAGIDVVISAAEQMGFHDEVAQLVTAKRLYAQYENAKAQGDLAMAKRYFDNANALYEKATGESQDLKATVDQFPAPFVYEGDVVTGTDVGLSMQQPRQQGNTYDQVPEVVDTKLLSDEKIIYGQEPDGAKEARAQAQSKTAQAFEGEIPQGGSPVINEQPKEAKGLNISQPLLGHDGIIYGQEPDDIREARQGEQAKAALNRDVKQAMHNQALEGTIEPGAEPDYDNANLRPIDKPKGLELGSQKEKTNNSVDSFAAQKPVANINTGANQPIRKPVSGNVKRPIRDDDHILKAVAKLGGVSKQEAIAQGIDPEVFKRKVALNNAFRPNGMSFDQMAEALSEIGYISNDYTANELLDKITLQLSGTDQLTPKGQEIKGERLAEEYSEALARQEHEDWLDNQQALEQQALDQDEELEAFQALSHQLYDTNEAREAVKADNASEEEILIGTIYHRAIDSGMDQGFVDQLLDKSQGDSYEFAAAIQEAEGQAVPTRSGEEDSRKIEEEKATEVDGEPLLTQQTESDIASREKENESQADFDQRAQIDREAELFSLDGGEATLGGSADVLQQGQGNDLFSAPNASINTPDQRTGQRKTGSVPEERAGSSSEKKTAKTEQVNTSPTDAQIEAGNYKKGHVTLHGLNITIENPKGSTRSGTSDNGTSWSHKMNSDYGYFKGTEGADGDHVDVFIGDDQDSKFVYVIDQVDANGSFDEHKVMLGYKNQKKATDSYKGNYDKGWKLGPVTKMTIPEFKAWLKGDDTKNPLKAKVESKPERKSELKSESKAKPKGYGENNTFVTKDRAEELREKLKAKLRSQLNAGFDPEMFAIGAELAAFHIESGARKFADFAKAMADDLGAKPIDLKQYLRAWYNGGRDMLEDGGVDVDGTDGPDAVRAEMKRITEGGSQPEGSTDSSASLADHLLGMIKDGTLPKDNRGLKKVAAEFDGKDVDNARLKQVQEQLEAAMAIYAREYLSNAKGSDKDKFDHLLNLYQTMPSLNIRTSTSVNNQAYSTPAPLAYLVARLAGIDSSSKVYEPTAGNGMLLLTANPANAIANELEQKRFDSLEAQGFNAHQGDAVKAIDNGIVKEKSQDAVITNPPFDSIKDSNGKATKVDFEGYKFGQIDHLIAAEALRTMKDGGKAALIISANKQQGGVSNSDRIFFNWLYSNYNVTGHFEAEGKLYNKQGANWPVRVISIDGRKKSNNIGPKEGVIQRYSEWSDLYEQANTILDAKDRGRGSNDSVSRTKSESVGNDGGSSPRINAEQGPKTDRGSRGASSKGGTGNVSGASSRNKHDTRDDKSGVLGDSANEQRHNENTAEQDRLDGTERGGSKPNSKEADRRGNDRGANGSPVSKPSSDGFQTQYTSRSSKKDDGILVPVNMAEPLQEALSSLEDEVGDIDNYVMEELGYSSMDALSKAFMGLQIDSVAAAINQIKKKKGLIIADQTGIGKGRQAAAIIRWAKMNGKTPIFVTVGPDLYTDMYEELLAIDTHDINPFLINKNGAITDPSDGKTKLFKNNSKHFDTLKEIAKTGKLPGDSNALFVTYPQINKANTQRQVLRKLAKNAVFILDESHKAGGESNTGEFMQEVLADSEGVTYLSATYAKRPDNMPLYFKTDIGLAAGDSESLIDAMDQGGLPLQTIVSNLLVKSGQMFRRERSYDGVEVKTYIDNSNKAKHEKLSDKITEALRMIVSADAGFHATAVKEVENQIEASGGRVKASGGNKASHSVQHTQFTSVVHNFIRQMLLGIKADKVADMAIEALERGEKPLVALESTMGSFLSDYVKQNNIKQGEGLGSFDYRNVLLKALDGTRAISVEDDQGNAKKIYPKVSELPPSVQQEYLEAERYIKSLDIDLPVSPIDWIRHRLEKAGYTIAEITGRTLIVDYSQGEPTLSNLPSEEKNDKVETTRKFNSGETNAIILNVSGSTGISLHASEKFANQDKRVMFIVQAAQDINVFMQMLGRVHRTGQVQVPGYVIVNTALPTEKRPTAMLNGKMKSLNANTSSNTDSATSVDSQDLLNKYGDQVVNAYLNDNPALADDLAVETTEEGDTAGLAKKATGRLALQDIKTQESFYEDVEAQYKSLIDYLNETNQNDLEPRTFDFEAELTGEAQLTPETSASSSFGSESVYGEYKIKRQGKPMTAEEVESLVEENLNGARNGREHAQNLIEEYKALETDSDVVKIEKKYNYAGLAIIQDYNIGSMWRLEIKGESYNAVVTGIKNSHKGKGDPFSPSKLQLQFAVNGNLRSLAIPASQIKGVTVAPLYNISIERAFNERSESSDEAKIVTGNLLAAFTELKDAKGTVITFTKKDGSTEQGILLPKKFTLKNNTRGDLKIDTGKDAMRYFELSNDPNSERFGISSRDAIIRVKPDGRGGIRVQVPKSKAKGGKYFLDETLIALTGDEFVSQGNFMVVDVRAKNAEKVIDYLMAKKPMYVLPSQAQEAAEILGASAPSTSVKPVGDAQVNKPIDTESVSDNYEADPVSPATPVNTNTNNKFEQWEKEHTKTGDQLFMVKPEEKLDRDEFKALASKAKGHGGYWSRFGKSGFLFKSEDDRASFIEAATQAFNRYSMKGASAKGSNKRDIKSALSKKLGKNIADSIKVVQSVSDLPKGMQPLKSVIQSSAGSATDTEAFKHWFGKSKVVDGNGDPLVVYHGTPDAREIFNSGRRFKTNNEKHFGVDSDATYFFTESYSVAKTYADDSRAFDYQNAQNAVLKSYLSIQNPYIVDAKGKKWSDLGGPKGQQQIIDDAKANGHDGILIKNTVDPYSTLESKRTDRSNVYIAFDAAQIKSAETGAVKDLYDGSELEGSGPNFGSFDPNNPDIRMSEDGGQDIEGAYNPDTGEIYLVADNLPDEARATWVAWHELWHRGIRAQDGRKVKHGTGSEGQALNQALNRAGLNKTIRQLSTAIMADRGLDESQRRIATEEALAELNAADETGDFESLESRYKVNVPTGMKPGIRGHIARFIDAVKAVFRKIGLGAKTTTNKEVMDIVRGGRHYTDTDGGGPGGGVRYSRGRGEGRRERRPDKFMERPLDRAFRSPLQAFDMLDREGRFKHGVKLTDKAEDKIKNWKPNPEGSFTWMNGPLETARAGLIDRYGLSDEYKNRWREAEADSRIMQMEAIQLFETTLKNMPANEARILQSLLTGEQVEGAEYNEIAEPIRASIDAMGLEAMELGLISEEAYERNRNEYLHRSYMKHEMPQNGLQKLDKKITDIRRRNIRGSALKARGLEGKLGINAVARSVPDGWLDDAVGKKLKVFDNLGDMQENGRRRVNSRHYWPADMPIPERFESMTEQGEFVIRAASNSHLLVWRDYTREERETMGEILDARYNIVKTYEVLSHDIAMGRFFKDISENPEWFSEDMPISDDFGADPVIVDAQDARMLATFAGVDWVKVPDTKVGVSQGAKKWGALSGGYVRAEIWRDLNEMDKMQTPEWYKPIVNQWKLNKTARSPVVHMNNIMSNMIFMDMADVSARNLAQGIHAYINNTEERQEAEKYGAFESTFINQEIRQNILKPLLEEMIQEDLASAEGADGAMGAAILMANRVFAKVKAFDDKMVNAYQIEDEIFRMATYMRRLELGDSPKEAAKIAKEQFLDYDIRAPWVNAARRTVLPFISYTYRAAPVMAKGIAHRPWKLAKYFAVAYMANLLSYLAEPGDEDEERRTMRNDQQGYTIIGTPRMLRMPWRDDANNPVFMDIRRYIPLGDVFDTNQGTMGALGIPAPLHLSGPIALAFETALNKTAFTQDAIYDADIDSGTEIAGKVSSHLYKSWMPSAAYIPGSWYWDKVGDAMIGVRDIKGQQHSIPQALVSSVGLKIRGHDVQMGHTYKNWDFQNSKRKLRQSARRLSMDFEQGRITKERYDKAMKVIDEKLQGVQIEARKVQTGK